MKFRNMCVLLLVYSAVMLNMAWAGDKIAVIDVTTLVEQSPDMTVLKKHLEKQFSARQKTLTQKQDAFQARVTKLNRDASVMKADELKQKRDQISNEQVGMQKEQVKLQQDFYQSRDQGLKKIMDKIQGIVKQVASKNGYTIVLRKEVSLYMQPGMDITQLVAAQLK